MPRCSRRGSLAQARVKVLVLSNILIYTSAATYVAALVWNRTQANRLVSGAMDGLFSPSYDGLHEMAVFEDGMRKQFSMAVFALEVNVSDTFPIGGAALLTPA